MLCSLVKEVGLDDRRMMAALQDTGEIQKYEEEVKEATRKGENGLQKLFGGIIFWYITPFRDHRSSSL